MVDPITAAQELPGEALLLQSEDPAPPDDLSDPPRCTWCCCQPGIGILECDDCGNYDAPTLHPSPDGLLCSACAAEAARCERCHSLTRPLVERVDSEGEVALYCEGGCEPTEETLPRDLPTADWEPWPAREPQVCEAPVSPPAGDYGVGKSYPQPEPTKAPPPVLPPPSAPPTRKSPPPAEALFGEAYNQVAELTWAWAGELRAAAQEGLDDVAVQERALMRRWPLPVVYQARARVAWREGRSGSFFAHLDAAVGASLLLSTSERRELRAKLQLLRLRLDPPKAIVETPTPSGEWQPLMSGPASELAPLIQGTPARLRTGSSAIEELVGLVVLALMIFSLFFMSGCGEREGRPVVRPLDCADFGLSLD